MLRMDRSASPLFVNRTLWGRLVVNGVCPGKLTATGLNCGTGTRPNPESATMCGLFSALSAITSEPFLFPRFVGLNVTLIVHSANGARDIPQSCVLEKSPDAAMEEKVTGRS